MFSRALRRSVFDSRCIRIQPLKPAQGHPHILSPRHNQPGIRHKSTRAAAKELFKQYPYSVSLAAVSYIPSPFKTSDYRLMQDTASSSAPAVSSTPTTSTIATSSAPSTNSRNPSPRNSDEHCTTPTSPSPPKMRSNITGKRLRSPTSWAWIPSATRFSASRSNWRR